LNDSTIKKEHRLTTSLRALHRRPKSGSTVPTPSPSPPPTDAVSTVPSPSPSHPPTDASSKGEEEIEETITRDLLPFFVTFNGQMQDVDGLLEVLGGYTFSEMSKSFNSLSEVSVLLFTPLSEGRKLQESSLSFTGTASFVSTEGNYVPSLEELHAVQRAVLEAFNALREYIHLWDPTVIVELAGIVEDTENVFAVNENTGQEMSEEAVEEEGNEAVESEFEDLSDQTGNEEQGGEESDREINVAENNNGQRTIIIAALTIVAVAAAICIVLFVSRRRMQSTVKKTVVNKENGSDDSTESKASGSDHEIEEMEEAAVSEENSAVLAKSDDDAKPEETSEDWASIFRHSSTAHREMLHTVKELVFHDPQKDPEPAASIVPKLEEKQVIVLNRVAVEDGSFPRIGDSRGPLSDADRQIPPIMEDESYSSNNSSAMDSLDPHQVPSVILPPKCHLDDDNNTGYLNEFALTGQVIDLGKQKWMAGLETKNSGGSFDSDSEAQHILRNSLQHPFASVLSDDFGIDDPDSEMCYV
jgi:hypothetical protein